MALGFVAGIVAILAGLLVLVQPKMLRLAVGFYLIFWGILQLF